MKKKSKLKFDIFPISAALILALTTGSYVLQRPHDKITIKNANTIESHKMRRVSICVDLKDNFSNELVGSTFGIFNEKGELVSYWDNEYTVYIEDLPDGTYTIDQLSTPKGYYPNNKTFIFQSDKEFQITEVKVNMTNVKKLIKTK